MVNDISVQRYIIRDCRYLIEKMMIRYESSKIVIGFPQQNMIRIDHWIWGYPILKQSGSLVCERISSSSSFDKK